MGHEDPLIEDDRMIALFRSLRSSALSSDFVARTMRAVKREPLPAGRRRLRNPITIFAGWAAVIAGVAFSAWMIAINQPVFASAFTTLVSGGIATGVSLMQFASTGLALLDLFTTTGIAVSRAVVTKEGSTGLMLIAVMGALSLSGLHRLLMSEGPERGVSQWQEL